MGSTNNIWQPIVEKMGIAKNIIPFVADYADRHSKNEKMDNIHSGNIESSVLPMALKILNNCKILEYMHWYVRAFDVEVQPKSYSVTADYTQGRRDKVESVENSLSEIIIDEISKEAVEIMFKLGDINRFYNRDITMKKGFVPEGEHVDSNQSLVNKLRMYVFGQAVKLSAGEPFIICNPQLACMLMLQEEGYEHLEPLSKCLTMNRVFIVGKYFGATVFVDSKMDAKDLRVLLGSSNSEALGGLVFEPLNVCHDMNVNANNSALNMGDGLSKVSVNSSYRFHSGSENSKNAYLTIKFELDK